MKPQFLDRNTYENTSFSINRYSNPYFLKVWHYHPQLELVLILESTGTRFIGDSIEKFEPGELILTGKNLPHLWQNDDIYFNKSSSLLAEAIAIHFTEDFAGTDLFSIPEMKSIRELLNRARQGIKFSGNRKEEAVTLITEISRLNDFEKVISLLKILQELSLETDFQLLASAGYTLSLAIPENKKLDQVYNHIVTNFRNDITLDEMAALTQMNPSAFSRFFKRVSHKSFSQYLNEVRVGYACKLLMEDKLNISGVGLESGFNNLSNFNRQFKTIKKISPSEYRSQFRN